MGEKRIKGTILKHCRDEFGEIIVAEDDGVRSLFFGDGVLQSSIRLHRPGGVIGEYNQSILSCLLFAGEIRSVLLIGLGGASLVHFLLRAFPSVRVDVVEIRKQVIDLAYGYFLLPKWNPNLRIFNAAGQDFVGEPAGECGNYDLIIVDAFDNSGPAAALTEISFLSACRSRLLEGGICVMNLWHRPKDNFPLIYGAFQKAFGSSTLKLLPDERCWNAIVFGFAQPVSSADLPAYRRVAKSLEQTHEINFPKYLQYLCWQNLS